MLSLRSTMPLLALALLTAAYCWLVWLGIGAYMGLIPHPPGPDWPWITRIVAQDALPFPFHALVVQGVAVVSLLLNCGWGVARSRTHAGSDAHMPPALCHVAVIVFSLCLVGAGMLAPIVFSGQVIR
jgi:hypothetical protein